MRAEEETLQERVLILAPTARDAETSVRLLRADGVACVNCNDLAHLCSEAERGAGAALLPEEVLVSDEQGRLNAFLSRQPAWSDFPLIIMIRKGMAGRGSLSSLIPYRTYALLDRPMQVAVLRTTIAAALRDRRRQYALRDHILQLQRTQESLRQADKRKDEFLAMLGHELRNPLAAVGGAAKLLSRQSISEEIKALALNTLDSQMKVMSRLINDLLDISRITSGKVVLKREPLDLRALIDRVVAGLRPAIDAAQHEIRVDLGRTDLWVLADAARLEQTFSNLISNSIKYTPPGGSITVAAELLRGKAVLSIRDTGIGISAENLPYVFDLFMQGQSSLARSQGGLGIGLTLVKNLVEMHGGEVFAASEGDGRGSTFTVHLPTVSAPVDCTASPIEAVRIARGRKVLVVDDNEDAARMLGMLLRDYGCEVEIAFNSSDAFEIAKTFRPEAALLDIGLPDISGYELAVKFRSQPELKGALLIAVTGYSKPEDRILSRNAGFQHHLAKPVDHEQLLSILAQDPLFPHKILSQNCPGGEPHSRGMAASR